MNTYSAIAACFLAMAGSCFARSEGARAQSVASEWSDGKLAAARMIGSASLERGHYRAGVEIRLKGASHTYWRNPGDAGAPPVFAFEGSRNLASARVFYPPPRRIVEDGSDIFGYLDSVVFPVEATPVDPKKPVELSLDLRYAACERICVPMEAHATLALTPGHASTAPDAEIAAAFKALPSPLEKPPRFTRAPNAEKPTWELRFDPPLAADADVFPAAPDNWFFTTRRAGDHVALTLEQAPSDVGAPVIVDLTLVGGHGAHETSVRIDTGKAR
jgi:DsbC/DsbD-like thiol-disulfide interchange protein